MESDGLNKAKTMAGSLCMNRSEASSAQRTMRWGKSSFTPQAIIPCRIEARKYQIRHI